MVGANGFDRNSGLWIYDINVIFTEYLTFNCIEIKLECDN